MLFQERFAVRSTLNRFYQFKRERGSILKSESIVTVILICRSQVPLRFEMER